MTKMIRRRTAIAAALAAPMLARHGWAQSAYPGGKTVRITTQTYKPGSAWITLVVIDDNQ